MQKRCNTCGQVKPLDDFYRASGMRDGRRGDCKTCNLAAKAARYRANPQPAIDRALAWQRANRDRFNSWEREYRKTHRNEFREGHLKRTFGMTHADYEAMLEAQGGGCAVCGDAPADGKSFHVDHLGDEVRGILCVRCNNALGLLRERVDLAERAADYLESGGFVPAALPLLHELAVERVQALRVA